MFASRDTAFLTRAFIVDYMSELYLSMHHLCGDLNMLAKSNR